MVGLFVAFPLLVVHGQIAEGTGLHAELLTNSTGQAVTRTRPRSSHFLSTENDSLFMADKLWAVAAKGRDASMDELLMSAVKWCVIWIAGFYALAGLLPRLFAKIHPSAKEHENNMFWMARCVLGIIHAIFIAALALPALVGFLGASEEARYSHSDDIAVCRIDPAKFGARIARDGENVALAGLAFTAFTLTDILLSMAHGLMTWDHMVHHVAFVAAGFIIRGHCMLPFNAAVLLSMEVSTPFLNVMLLFRYRGARYGTLVMVNGCIFFLLFIVFRLGFNTYGTMLLWYNVFQGKAFELPLSIYQVVFLVAAVTVGTAVQLFWFPSIARIFVGKILGPSTKHGKDLEDEDINSGRSSSSEGSNSNSNEEK